MFRSLATLRLLAAGALSQVLTPTTTPTLNITAIAASAERTSVLQCWQLAANFTASTTGGITGALTLFLGDQANATFTVIPPRFDGGLHNAPARQHVSPSFTFYIYPSPSSSLPAPCSLLPVPIPTSSSAPLPAFHLQKLRRLSFAT